MKSNGDEEDRSMNSGMKCGLFGCVKNRFDTRVLLDDAKQVLRDAQLQAQTVLHDAQLQADDLIGKARVEATSTISQASKQVLQLRSEIQQLQGSADRIRDVESAKAKSTTGFPICVRWIMAKAYEFNDGKHLEDGYEPFAAFGRYGNHILYRKCVTYA
ncbi:hypothetical protein MIR68_008142 [Amoeboaphelidium protococcarum]|nr:hypothetical protein MIR68_008142 [Amoeboaphelidium protococcarum]